jgi:hypothetical protein
MEAMDAMSKELMTGKRREVSKGAQYEELIQMPQS